MEHPTIVLVHGAFAESGSWNDVIIERMGTPFCRAWVRRAEKLRPSRRRSTSNRISTSGSPVRRK